MVLGIEEYKMLLGSSGIKEKDGGGDIPSLGHRPCDGRIPTTPQHIAGARKEPAVSLPSPTETIPAATAAAVPDELAPALYSM